MCGRIVFIAVAPVPPTRYDGRANEHVGPHAPTRYEGFAEERGLDVAYPLQPSANVGVLLMPLIGVAVLY